MQCLTPAPSFRDRCEQEKGPYWYETIPPSIKGSGRLIVIDYFTEGNGLMEL